MKYLVYYDEYADSIMVNGTRPSRYAPEAGFDDDEGIYYATVEADNKEQATIKAFSLFANIAYERMDTWRASCEKIKDKMMEVMK